MRSFVLLLAVAACAKPEVTPSDRPNTTPQEQGSSPVVVTWKQLELSDGSALLNLEIQKQIALERELSVSLVVPPRVTLEPVASSFTIPAKDVGTIVRTFRVRWTQLPTEDLVAVADSQGAAAGFHAVAPFRFGRAIPVDPPARRGAPAQLGIQPLGSPVDLSKP